MKILAIRGKNLNSLEEPFELNLEEAPFYGTGLFAIIGPTGSGKTTLLDAMCLALFDAIPRYRETNRFQAEETRDSSLSSNDPRNIMRLGSIEAFAEVDFKGVDGHTYRAGWQVRRARNRSDGRIQSQSMTLHNLDLKQDLSDSRKTEVRKLIDEKLGLDYHQFCRAVLLAQGDFAAFLKANPKDRALLLERITGTDIYSRLSKAAFERYKQEQEQLAQLQREREALNLLEPEAITALQATAQQAEQDEQAWTQQLKALHDDINFYQIQTRLAQQVHEAQQEVAAAQQLLDNLPTQELEAIFSAQPLRPYLDACEQAQKQLEDLAQTLTKAENDHAQTRQRQQTLQHQWDQALGAVDSAKADQERLAEAISQAGQLDARIAEKRERHQDAQNQWNTANEARNQAAAQVAQWESQQKKLQSQAAELTRRSTAQAQDQQWVQSWPLIQAELERAIQIRPELVRLEQELARLEVERPSYLANLTQTREQLQQAQQQLREAELQTETLERAEQLGDPEAFTRQLQQAHGRREDLNTLKATMIKLLEAETELNNLATQEATDHRRLGELESLKQRDQQEQILQKVRVDEAERALNQAKAARGLSERRAELLEEGNPCPLCGSIEHPWRQHRDASDPVELLLHAQEERFNALRQEERATTQRLGETTAHIKGLEDQLARLTQERRRWMVRRNEGTGVRDRLRLSLDPPLNTLLLEEVEQEYATLSESIQRLSALQRQAAEHQQKTKVAAAAVRAAHQQVTQIAETSRVHEQAWSLLEHDLQAHQKELATLNTQWHQCLEHLAPLFSHGWSPQALEANAVGFAQEVSARQQAWQQLQEDRAQGEAALTEAAHQLATAKATLSLREEPLAPLRQQTDTFANELKTLLADRAKLLQGESVAAVQTRLERRLHEAEQQRETLLASVNNLEGERKTLIERLHQLGQQREAAQTRAARAQAELQLQLQEAGLDEPRLRTYLRHDRAWCDHQRTLLNQAQQRVTTSNTRLQERQERLREHQNQPMPNASLAQLENQLQLCQQRLDQTRRDKLRSQLELEKDEQNRRNATSWVPKYERQLAETELWAEMNKLIGSHDGTSFRKFAQGLTLDVLIAAANDHLVELEPRYCLKRVTGEDLELEVADRYMADDARGLAGLSGGETFLVSLALALGLSSLNTEVSQIESLFIDEGFGALDPSALDVALAYLEQLQATGRQVGIISHVSAVAERVDNRVQLIRKGDGRSIVRTSHD